MLRFLEGLSSTEIIVIVLIIVVLLGPKIATRLSRIAGETVKEIKNVKKNFNVDEDDSGKKKEVSKK